MSVNEHVAIAFQFYKVRLKHKEVLKTTNFKDISILQSSIKTDSYMRDCLAYAISILQSSIKTLKTQV